MKSLLQLKIDSPLKEAISQKAKKYGVPASSLIRIALTQAFMDENNDDMFGNIFNADRDNEGKGIPVKDFLEMLKA
ncbi:MAG: BrnA antitoxin family protein [Melioribacteraceae bacterium]|nr:BrnA antitoxin family protein [Melioribacteraceae bacterium]